MTFPTWDANGMRAWACAVKPGDDPNRVRAVTRDDPLLSNRRVHARRRARDRARKRSVSPGQKAP